MSRYCARSKQQAGPTIVSNPFEQDLEKNPANYQPLTPLSFLARSAVASPNHIAIIHGNAHTSYAEFYIRTRRLACALAMRSIGPGDTVSVMLANTPPMLEAHYGVAMTGAVLHTINTRLDPAIIAFQLDHADTKLLITDREFSGVVKAALALAKAKPTIIDYNDPQFPQPGEALSSEDY
jgi:fatty-acyl-CoA synthase